MWIPTKPERAIASAQRKEARVQSVHSLIALHVLDGRSQLNRSTRQSHGPDYLNGFVNLDLFHSFIALLTCRQSDHSGGKVEGFTFPFGARKAAFGAWPTSG